MKIIIDDNDFDEDGELNEETKRLLQDRIRMKNKGKVISLKQLKQKIKGEK